MTTTARICLVDDDAELADLLKRKLTGAGYTVEHFSEGESFLAALRRMQAAGEKMFDLILMDVMLPGQNGIFLCQQLRSSGGPWAGVPILFLSALGESIDRIVGLEAGGDDYLAKPFVTRELLARIHSLLRRSAAQQVGGTGSHIGTSVQIEDYTVNLLSHQLTDKDGVVVPLSACEFRLLSIFLEHPGELLSRDKIMQLAGERGSVVFDRSIDTQVKRLRKKLKDDGRNPRIILTMRGDGYMFVNKFPSATI